MARAFKVRSAERDAQTDSDRLGSISAAVEAAVASALLADRFIERHSGKAA